MRICMTLGEIQEARTKRIKKVANALDEVLKVEKLLREGTFKNTKEILLEELEKANNIGRS